jgi:hypothetical protein
MSDGEVRKLVHKLHKLRALRRVREQVRQLEWELNGAPASPEDLPRVPEFPQLLGLPLASIART